MVVQGSPRNCENSSSSSSSMKLITEATLSKDKGDQKFKRPYLESELLWNGNWRFPWSGSSKQVSDILSSVVTPVPQGNQWRLPYLEQLLNQIRATNRSPCYTRYLTQKNYAFQCRCFNCILPEVKFCLKNEKNEKLKK